jgi:hypothetical protein
MIVVIIIIIVVVVVITIIIIVITINSGGWGRGDYSEVGINLFCLSTYSAGIYGQHPGTTFGGVRAPPDGAGCNGEMVRSKAHGMLAYWCEHPPGPTLLS